MLTPRTEKNLSECRPELKTLFSAVAKVIPLEVFVGKRDKATQDKLFAEITACLMKDDGTDLIKTLSGAGIEVVSEAAGQIKILLSTADTDSLQAVDGGSFELKIIDPDITDILQFKRSLFVIESEC